MGATYFFRDYHTLKMIPSLVIPLVLENRNNIQNLNIWSAGCANGSEPYTIALILKENLENDIFEKVNIYATDIDPNFKFKEIISRGSYTREYLKKVPEDIFINNFEKDTAIPGNYAISDKIKTRVIYIQHDLNSMIPPGELKFDIIICKNVLIHFKKKEIPGIFRMFHDSLTDGGFLITEQTQKIPPKIECKFRQLIGNAQIHKKI